MLAQDFGCLPQLGQFLIEKLKGKKLDWSSHRRITGGYNHPNDSMLKWL